MRNKALNEHESPCPPAQTLGAAKILLAAGAHWGRLTRCRQAPPYAIAAKRQGIDMIDLARSAGALLNVARMLRKLDPSEVAWAAARPEAVAALGGLDFQGRGPVALGRWKPGSMSNRAQGAWRDERPKAMVLVGSGMEIAAREANKAGAHVVWLCDTHENGSPAHDVIWINASSARALKAALDLLTASL